MSLTLTTGECKKLAAELEAAAASGAYAVGIPLLADLLPRLQRASTPRQSRAAGRRFEQRVANELRFILAELSPEWKVSRNQTDRQRGQVGGAAGEFTVEGPAPFHWAFELKDGDGFQINQLFRSPIPTPLASSPKKEGFWAQAVRQAAVVERRPLLIVREAGDPHHEFAVLRPVDRALLLPTPSRVRLSIEVGGEVLDVCLWSDLRAAGASRWVL